MRIVNEEDKKAFLQDFTKADIKQKLDMWYYAIDQEALWEEILEEMSTIATKKQMEEAHTLAKSKGKQFSPTCNMNEE